MTTQSNAPKNGLNALLTPEESVLVLIDHQPFQFANLHSHEPQMIVNNVIALAKGAKAFGVPTILTTINASTGGALLPGIQDVFPEQTPIDRTMINTWQDELVVKLVRESGLDWVIARPGRLTDGPARRRYVKKTAVEPVPGKISRADVADFLVTAIEVDTWLREAVQLGG